MKAYKSLKSNHDRSTPRPLGQVIGKAKDPPPPNKIMFDPIFLNFAQSLSLQDIQNQFETLLNTCTELFTLSSIHSAGA